MRPWPRPLAQGDAECAGHKQANYLSLDCRSHLGALRPPAPLIGCLRRRQLARGPHSRIRSEKALWPGPPAAHRLRPSRPGGLHLPGPAHSQDATRLLHGHHAPVVRPSARRPLLHTEAHDVGLSHLRGSISCMKRRTYLFAFLYTYIINIFLKTLLKKHHQIGPPSGSNHSFRIVRVLASA